VVRNGAGDLTLGGLEFAQGARAVEKRKAQGRNQYRRVGRSFGGEWRRRTWPATARAVAAAVDRGEIARSRLCVRVQWGTGERGGDCDAREVRGRVRGAPAHRPLRRVRKRRTHASQRGPWPTFPTLASSSSSRCPASATGESPPPPPLTVLSQAILRFSPSPAASFSGAGELPPPITLRF
jgi:hypothetical protein